MMQPQDDRELGQDEHGRVRAIARAERLREEGAQELGRLGDLAPGRVGKA
jgi:hypothetical protein